MFDVVESPLIFDPSSLESQTTRTGSKHSHGTELVGGTGSAAFFLFSNRWKNIQIG